MVISDSDAVFEQT